MTTKIVWFARGGGIARAGPFDSQLEATAAIRLAPEPELSPAWAHLADPAGRRPAPYREFPVDAFVWPEEVSARKPRKTKS